MSISINSHPLDLTVASALVGVKESSESCKSKTVYASGFCSFFEVLTEILGPGTAYRLRPAQPQLNSAQAYNATAHALLN